jgi:hypothetical protein
MKRYQAALRNHLAVYAKRRLGVQETGVYKGRTYPHILPYRLRFLNLLESFRAEIQDYLRAHPSIQLHRYFHHLNSSQALAFNLFYPFFAAGGTSARALTGLLGAHVDVSVCDFEVVPDKAEGTNVDVFWRDTRETKVFCEVKLSEAEFGMAKDDSRHRRKLAEIYKPRLASLVSERLLEKRRFFRNYQLLRNLALLAGSRTSVLVLLFPQENEALQFQLEEVLDNLTSFTRHRVYVAHLEKVLKELRENVSLGPQLRNYAMQLEEKYVIGAKTYG